MMFQGHVKNGVVVFDGTDRPAEGTEVVVELLQSTKEPTAGEVYQVPVGLGKGSAKRERGGEVRVGAKRG